MPIKKPVTGPDGTVYPSIKAAADALGVHRCTIVWNLDRYGNLSMLGTWSVPCQHKGKRYTSMTECAKKIGVARHTLSHHLSKHGNLDRAGRGRSGGNPGNKGRRRAITIGPLHWDRRKDAAAELGISEPTLFRWLSPTATPEQREKLMALAMEVQARRARKAAKSTSERKTA